MIDLLVNESFRFLLLINFIAALGMNIVYATGQLNLGQAGFLAIGAYTAAVTEKVLGWPLPMSLLASAMVAALVALPIALGANRVRGIYLIMGTLAVGEIVQVAIGNMESLGGLQGYSGITPTTLTEATAVFVLILLGTMALMSSPLGLRMRAVFDDEDAAAAAGVPSRLVKVTAVVISAGVVGVAGGLTAKWLLFIAPRNFGMDVSFRIALFTLVGGVHSILGALTGAFFITFLLEALRTLGGIESFPVWLQAFGPWRQVIYGLLIMVLMALRPEGLISRQWALSLTNPFRGWQRSLRHRQNPIPATRPESILPGTKPLLKLQAISHAFGGLAALQDVSLTIYQGEILALIGANGAGKTTLINVISGHYALQKGRILLGQEDLSRRSPHHKTQAGISRTFQSLRTFAHLTAEEHLRLGQMARHGRPAPSIETIVMLIGLAGRLDALPHTLTLGEQRRLEIGRAVASNPWVLFLDEPSVGMNEVERAELAQLIRCIREQGITVVLIDHNLDMAFSLADRVAVLDFGKLLTVGLPGDVVRDPRVRTAYLGQTKVTI